MMQEKARRSQGLLVKIHTKYSIFCQWHLREEMAGRRLKIAATSEVWQVSLNG